MLNERIKRVLEEKEKKDLDCIVILNKSNIYYLTNFYPDTFSALVIKDEPVLYISKMDLKRIKNSLEVKVITYENVADVFRYVQDVKKIGIEKSEINLNFYETYLKNVELFDFQTVFNMRRSKDDSEIKNIKNSIKICKEVFEDIRDKLKIGISEIDVKLDIEKRIKKISDVAFEPIVAFDENTSIPHHKATRKKLKEIALIDIGVRTNYYCCDITRTIVIRNRRKYLDLYEMLDSIKREVIKKLKPNILTKKIDLYVRERLGEMEKNFIHSTGHGIGIDVHEAPKIYKYSNDTLYERDVVTIEPAIYLDDFGIRIEEDVLVKKTGIILSKSI